ncbi:MAG: hypothetical protein GW911_31080 [Armatimonadetes bacterium]|nr:hypothetical protein [Armatimonadota bacterium]NCO96281.1 hypothetical protein [Armatimonadota bacterium]NCP34909.1 hypothetical protein [Armatimonadota bacterium]NCQ33264.1 hypothetical protein [Armatimonadota bacterium]NDK16496.1 hypothetical protein [Armatimonadota bacterium]
MREFHHIGMPTDEKQPNEMWVPATRVSVTDPDDHPYKVEFLRYEPDSPVTGPLRDLPHVCFTTDDYEREIEGKEVILGPFRPDDTRWVVFVMQDGIAVEYMQYDA